MFTVYPSIDSFLLSSSYGKTVLGSRVYIYYMGLLLYLPYKMIQEFLTLIVVVHFPDMQVRKCNVRRSISLITEKQVMVLIEHNKTEHQIYVGTF